MTQIFDYQNKAQITKRQAWGLVALFFDVLGIGTLCGLLLKLLRQEIDRKYPKARWEHPLSKTETKKWQAAIESLRALLQHKIPCIIVAEDEF